MSGFVLDTGKVRDLAKSSHSSCHGSGVLGIDTQTRHVIVCPCVWRAMKARGVDVRNAADVRKAIGREPEAQRSKEDVSTGK
ncbi:MAG: hypothetical protein IH577_04485 [Deltaproteobacteria bacterium]|nr:hypothetical protein [Deltaproteobacteria bacterium]